MRGDHERAVAGMRAALGEEEFAGAWAEGQALSLDEAVAAALAALDAVATGEYDRAGSGA